MHEIPGGIILPGIPYIDKMVRYSSLKIFRWLCGTDIQTTVDLDRICVDDLKAFAEETIGQSRLAYSGRTGEDDSLIPRRCSLGSLRTQFHH